MYVMSPAEQGSRYQPDQYGFAAEHNDELVFHAVRQWRWLAPGTGSSA
jgi:hypothetical protein